MKVLVVEDDQNSSEIIEEILIAENVFFEITSLNECLQLSNTLSSFDILLFKLNDSIDENMLSFQTVRNFLNEKCEVYVVADFDFFVVSKLKNDPKVKVLSHANYLADFANIVKMRSV